MGPLERLERFVHAQSGAYDTALDELRKGKKQGHWIWFVFPQMAGLGRSSTSRFYGIQNLGEARAYLAHPILGERLRECTRAVLGVEGQSVEQIFGYPDWMKFRSSMTLFHLADPDVPEFGEALHKYFDGALDPRTVEMCGPR